MTAVDTLITDLRGNRQSATDQPIIANTDTLISALQSLASGAAVTLAGDASGLANANQVTLTHLAAPLPIAQGGTNAATAAAALASLGAMPLLFAITNLVAAGTGTKNTLNRVDATAGALNIQMPAPANAGDWVAFRKIDASANRVTVQYLGTDMAWLSAQHDTVLFYSGTGSTWLVYFLNIAPLQQVFTSSGTWTKPPLAKQITVNARSGGGGGGSGRRGAAGSGRSGGIGGWASQAISNTTFASNLPGSVTVTIGANGTGGGAQTVNDTSGNSGTDGGVTSFGTYLKTQIGIGGPGGTAAATATSNTATQYTTGATTSQQSSVTAALTLLTGVSAGGTGGSITTGNANLAGAPGGPSSVTDPVFAQAAFGGLATNGSDGATGSADFNSTFAPSPGGGGGGGGGASTDGVTVGGNGGAAANYGAGGGGGGASTNGSNSGAGGNGSPGYAAIQTVF